MPATTATFWASSLRPRMASIRARVAMPLEQPGHQSVLGVRKSFVMSAVGCGLNLGAAQVAEGAASSSCSSTKAVIVELLCNQGLDLGGGDELAVDATVVDNLGLAGHRSLDLPGHLL